MGKKPEALKLLDCLNNVSMLDPQPLRLTPDSKPNHQIQILPRKIMIIKMDN